MESGRILATLAFRRPDGEVRPALAWLNMGVPRMNLSVELAHDLGADEGRPVNFGLGPLAVDVAPDMIEVGAPRLDGEDVLSHLFAPLRVEAILPAGVLQRYRMVIDYPARLLTLSPAAQGSIPPGVATPVTIDPATGVIVVDADVAGERHPIAVDAGASFTWLRGSSVRRWLEIHPDWRRAEGAVGPSNMGLTSLAFEREGTLVRLPQVAIAGGLALPDVYALGTAPLICRLCDNVVGDLFWDGWEKNAPVPVAGWLGNNVLGDFRLTVDYPNRVLYWQRTGPVAAHVVDQVGVSLVRAGSDYRIGGVVLKDGRPAVDGVAAGDKLVAVDGRTVGGLSSDDVLRALGGQPGSRHILAVDRGGVRIDVDAPVSRF